jgi:hypothetical protein
MSEETDDTYVDPFGLQSLRSTLSEFAAMKKEINESLAQYQEMKRATSEFNAMAEELANYHNLRMSAAALQDLKRTQRSMLAVRKSMVLSGISLQDTFSELDLNQEVEFQDPIEAVSHEALVDPEPVSYEDDVGGVYDAGFEDGVKEGVEAVTVSCDECGAVVHARNRHRFHETDEGIYCPRCSNADRSFI